MRSLNELLWDKEELENHSDYNLEKELPKEGKLIMMLDHCLGRSCGGNMRSICMTTPCGP